MVTKILPMASPKLPSINSGILLGKNTIDVCGPISYEIANLITLNEDTNNPLTLIQG
jgi:hypothetical protein